MTATGLGITYLFPLYQQKPFLRTACVHRGADRDCAEWLHLDLREPSGIWGNFPTALPVFLLPDVPAKSPDAAHHPAIFCVACRGGTAWSR